MPLPNRDRAHIDRRKLTEYLLNRNHPDAKGKSAFFCSPRGSDWKRLRDDLFAHAEGTVVEIEETGHRTRYVIEELLLGAGPERLNDPNRRIVPTACHGVPD